MEIDEIKARIEAEYPTEEPKPFTPIKEGDILLANWGYEGNNPDFFKIIKRTAKQVVMMLLEEEVVGHGTHPLGESYVIPTNTPATWSVWRENNYGENENKPVILTKKVKVYERDGELFEYVELAYYAWAKLWNGKPAHDYCWH